ncbi:hypothetical protein RIF29_16696 [Crotalaria pallida]|uniref:Uncharacterized protein n=1 Tax=Crotalaria pallida TaxID=3830 RepID=A0AAN9FFM7_CROPI
MAPPPTLLSFPFVIKAHSPTLIQVPERPFLVSLGKARSEPASHSPSELPGYVRPAGHIVLNDQLQGWSPQKMPSFVTTFWAALFSVINTKDESKEEGKDEELEKNENSDLDISEAEILKKFEIKWERSDSDFDSLDDSNESPNVPSK